MAVVYKAYDTHLECNVAIKVILPTRQHSDKFIKRFGREIKALLKLSHPNIVRVIDYGEQDGLPYLVMEYIPGGTLKQKLSANPMPWQQAVRVLIPIARALAYSHEHNIIHRDVKPSNILITDSGELMLSDFGIAKILEGEETLELTGTGVGIGTPEYMSPEQAQGQAVDARSDVYSLGVILYEMIAGRKPYQADTPYAVVIKHVNEPLPRPRQFIKDLPERVEQILVKALAKRAENRFQDMTAFANVLAQLASSRKASIEKIPWKFYQNTGTSLVFRTTLSFLVVLIFVIGGIITRGLNKGDGGNLQSWSPGLESQVTLTSTLSARAYSTANAQKTLLVYDSEATQNAILSKKYVANATANAMNTFEAWLAEPPLPIVTPGILANSVTQYQVDFSSRPSGSDWGFSSSAMLTQGILRQTGHNWEGSTRPAILSDHEGVLLEFRCSPQSEAEIFLQSGGWNAPGMRRWGLYCTTGDVFSSNVFRDASESLFQQWNGNMIVKPGSWYALYLLVGGYNDFIARIWEPGSPDRYMEMRNAFGNNWANLKWAFTVGVNQGEIDIVNYKEIKIP